MRCKANSWTVCVAKQIRGGRELGTHAMRQARVFVSYVIYLVCTKYVVLSHYVLDVRLVLFREVRLCWKVVLCREYILFG